MKLSVLLAVLFGISSLPAWAKAGGCPDFSGVYLIDSECIYDPVKEGNGFVDPYDDFGPKIRTDFYSTLTAREGNEIQVRQDGCDTLTLANLTPGSRLQNQGQATIDLSSMKWHGNTARYFKGSYRHSNSGWVRLRREHGRNLIVIEFKDTERFLTYFLGLIPYHLRATERCRLERVENPGVAE